MKDGNTQKDFMTVKELSKRANCGLNTAYEGIRSGAIPHIRIGKLIRIPIKAYEEFSADYPEYALLVGWNHAEEIMAQEQTFMESGGKWILYVPEVKVC